MKEVIIIHYSEIGTKGKNRPNFEVRLAGNINNKLTKIGVKTKSIRDFGRIVVFLKEGELVKKEEIKKTLSNIPGIAYFGFGFACEKDFEAIKKTVLFLARSFVGSFKIDVRRSDKNYPIDSQKMNEILGEVVLNKNDDLGVELSRPDNIIWVEITAHAFYVYTEKCTGMGGLPTGTGGQILSLISAGFDSPVASFLMQKRGASVLFIHFHSYPYVSQSSLEQVKLLFRKLSDFQNESRLFLFPFAEIQKEIIAKTPEKLRVILYRRTMLKIAEKIAEKEKCETLLTGESLGQVSSQTLRNMSVTEKIVKIPVLRPLVGFNKEEIINLAKKIDTYEISAEPYEDSCSFMMPAKVETHANLEEVEEKEKALGKLSALINEGIKKMETIE